MVEDVRIIREKYETTNITMGDLAKEYNIGYESVKSCLRYFCWGNVDPDKKDIYKINCLKGNELNMWLRNKKAKKL